MKEARELTSWAQEGTATFLLAQLEGPRGREARRERTPRSVDRFVEIHDRSVAAHGGAVSYIDDTGGTIASFPRAAAAMAAALDVHRELQEEAIAAGESISVRMAIHTGDAERDENGRFAGHAIAHATSLRDAAHVGQVLVSGVTADIAGERLPESVELVDLGTYWLKDLQRRRRIYQLIHPELRRSFPPLGSLDTIPNNLPVRLTSFIGRVAERAELQHLLSNARQLTLTGAGGCGKTRLAVEIAADVAARYPDGIWWADLATISTDDLVPDVVMAALDIGDTRGTTPTDRIARQLSEGSSLLILDNCEQARFGCGALTSTLLGACDGLTVLTTSREALGIEGETVWRVPPLSLPVEGMTNEPEALTAYDAVRLFIDRATEARPNFRITNENAPVVAQICARLDGIPLAIELAAARVRMLSVERILVGLDDRFRLLTGGAGFALPRHQTLLSSVEWSHELLTESERAVLRRLAVFAGGFVLDAAERVCSGDSVDELEILDLLGQLVDKSLVLLDEAGPDRYRLLETIRHFASARLEQAGETADARNRHLAFFTALAETMAPQIERTADVSLLDRFEAERENFRVALGWALETGAIEGALRLAGALSYIWGFRGHYWEAQSWLRRALTAGGSASEHEKAWALWGLGNVSLFGMDVTSGFGYAATEEALALARGAKDNRIVTRSLVALAFIELLLLPDVADARLTEALTIARTSGDEPGVASVLGARAFVLGFFQDRHDEAGPLFAEMRSLAKGIGNRYLIAMCDAGDGAADTRRGRYGEARTSLEAALAVSRDVGEPVLEMTAATLLVDVEIAEGLFESAKRLVDESGERLRRSARGRIEAIQLRLAATLLAEGDLEGARALCDALVQPVNELGIPYFAAQLSALLGRLGAESGELDAARQHLEQALGLARALDNPWLTAVVLHLFGRVHRAQDEADKAEDKHHQALALRMQHGFRADAVDSLEAIAGLAAAGESWAEAVRLCAAADVTRDELRAPRQPIDQPLYSADLEDARAALGDEAFAAAWAEGALLSLEQACAYASRARGGRRRPSSGWSSLTPTEIDVVRLAKQGLTNPEIAERLFITRATVKTHLAHIYAKVGVSSRTELAAEATRRGI